MKAVVVGASPNGGFSFVGSTNFAQLRNLGTVDLDPK